MIAAPIPIGLLVPGVEPVEIIIFAVSFLDPHAVGLILMIIPRVLVMMLRVAVAAIVFSFFAVIVLSPRRCRHKCHWSQQRSP